jgi:hypothetical protein
MKGTSKTRPGRTRPSSLMDRLRRDKAQSGPSDPGARLEAVYTLSAELRKLKAAALKKSTR